LEKLASFIIECFGIDMCCDVGSLIRPAFRHCWTTWVIA